VTGGLLGALTSAGISEEDAQVFVEGVRRCGTLVVTRVPQSELPRMPAGAPSERLESIDLCEHLD
jgi:hypothetical protein